MNHENLSNRLQHVANFVPKHAMLADIGSDHAYLPCYLALNQHIKGAIAGEVVKGPFESAKKHVAQLQLNHIIDVRLANGLMAIDETDNVDTVTICGMGGDLIATILNEGYAANKLKTVQTCILQPNVDESSVRKWLMTHGFSITQEVILKENDKIYEIIVAKPTSETVTYTEDECLFGVFLPRQKSAVFIEKWQREIQKLTRVVQSMQQAKVVDQLKIEQFERTIAKIKRVIGEDE